MYSKLISEYIIFLKILQISLNASFKKLIEFDKKKYISGLLF